VRERVREAGGELGELGLHRHDRRVHFGHFELSRLAHRFRLVRRLLLDLLSFPAGGVTYLGRLVGHLLRDHGGLVRGSLRYRGRLVVSDREDPLRQGDRVLVPGFYGPAGSGITLQRWLIPCRVRPLQAVRAPPVGLARPGTRSIGHHDL
jgi:hypothetical protein